MTANSMLVLMTLLLIKHYLADFPLQRPFMYKNKGVYGHIGGIFHAWIHGVGTFAAVSVVLGDVGTGALMALYDMLIHYHIDWAKVKITFEEGWCEYLTVVTNPCAKCKEIHREIPPHLAIYSDAYFQALGLDQLFHALTYAMIGVFVGVTW
jgi:hypothetical protein